MLRLVILCVTYLLRRNHFWALRSETSKRFVILWQRNQVLSHLKHFKASRRGHSHSCNLPGLVWLGAYSFAQPYVVRKSWARFNFDVYALPSIHCLCFIYARKCTCVGTRKLQKVMVGEGNFWAAGIFFRINWLAWIFFHLIFPSAKIFFVLRPPPISFLMVRP